MNPILVFEKLIPFELSGQRFDQAVAQMLPQYSRAKLQEWIQEGQLTLNGAVVKPNRKVVGGERFLLNAQLKPTGEWEAQDLSLNIIYEDEDLLIINKSADLVVHPAAGNHDGTLLNGLLHHCPSLKQIPRAGIVHRLDKDTTGLMVVAKTLESQNSLVAQLQAHSVKRQYLALVVGAIPSQGKVDAAIGRDPHNRIKMAVVKKQGKPAVTHFQRLARLGPFSLVRLNLETGRTHQIRVHMTHLGFPLVGDPMYGRNLRKLDNIPEEAMPCIEAFQRQALHAEALSLVHPRHQTLFEWHAECPPDMTALLAVLGLKSSHKTSA